MNVVNITRIGGLLVALGAAITAAANKDYSSAVGIVAAALSSAGLKKEAH